MNLMLNKLWLYNLNKLWLYNLVVCHLAWLTFRSYLFPSKLSPHLLKSRVIFLCLLVRPLNIVFLLRLF